MKAKATALFLLCTEVLGLNCWLVSVGVQRVLPYCVYGWRAQTVKHFIFCGHYNSRGLVSLTGTEDLRVMLSHPIKEEVVAR